MMMRLRTVIAGIEGSWIGDLIGAAALFALIPAGLFITWGMQ